LKSEISYGKAQVSTFRTYARPLRGVEAVPESAFTGRENTLFGVEVEVEVFGDNFLAAYTHGDNSNVVATDSMKNFILKEAVSFEGSTLESFLYFLGSRFLGTYPQMQTLRLSGVEQPFDTMPVPSEGGGFEPSNVLFSRSHNSRAVAVLDMERDASGEIRLLASRSGIVGLQLIKVTGSSFASFVRDEYTTLPERKDRPLFIYLDVHWKYSDPALSVADDTQRYIPAEQVRDFVGSVFHRFVSMSIQHLVYEMGTNLLERYPQMSEISFDAQNRLWDLAFTSDQDDKIKVYTEPRPPYGHLKLTLGREE
jgi:urate oxidase / 2-oxo-4-hydroxy-4-carboxy-5-ureidoimidazoline decarboxylase